MLSLGVSEPSQRVSLKALDWGGQESVSWKMDKSTDEADLKAQPSLPGCVSRDAPQSPRGP